MKLCRTPKDPVDPERDKRNLDYELMLADIASIEKRMERLEKDLKKLKNAALEKELAYLQRAKAWLESEKPLREMEVNEDERKLVRGFAFLSEKPMIYVENVGEDQLDRLAQSRCARSAARQYGADDHLRKARSRNGRTAPRGIEDVSRPITDFMNPEPNG